MVHVANGCYVSAAAYIARFTVAYPAERSEPAAVVLPNADGSSKPHTRELDTATMAACFARFSMPAPCRTPGR